MSRAGFSGARIEIGDNFVLKNGKGCHDQAMYLKELRIGPEIYVIGADGYGMERLYHEPLALIHEEEIFRVMLRLLDRVVWQRRHHSHPWKGHLKTWLLMNWNFPGVACPVHLMDRLYDHRYEEFGQYIHGDPTLSNVMVDKHGDIKLIDPIRPEGKIPWLKDVDLGKMLQSVIGWEHVVFNWDMPEDTCVQVFYAHFTTLELERALFWLMIHALRIIPYAKGNSLTSFWARQVALSIEENFEKEDPCNTLMTLMELSSRLAKLYWQPTAPSA